MMRSPQSLVIVCVCVCIQIPPTLRPPSVIRDETRRMYVRREIADAFLQSCRSAAREEE